jgi:4-hydroxy-2-oxoheptanedioate aldolase
MKARELKEALHNGKVVIGLQQFTPSPVITELAGRAGFDFVWICCEHGPTGYGTELENMVRAANAADVVPIVRITENEPWMIMKCLDAGAKGIIVPRVKTREDVARAVRACKYPPQGERGCCSASRSFWYYGQSVSRDLQTANEEVIVMIIVEQREAVENIRELLQVEGLDAVLFGHGDLSVEMGLRERLEAGDPEAVAILKEARGRVLGACKELGVPFGQLVYSHEDAERAIAEGATVLNTQPDWGWFLSLFRGFVQGIRAATPAYARL